ncbi:hypothetical protein GCM10012320_34400 [Sinomonas cellulolyticus]|nr:hypothetical protein GCM10012320_34400 [Sinomonas sp. KCTC 49339]
MLNTATTPKVEDPASEITPSPRSVRRWGHRGPPSRANWKAREPAAQLRPNSCTCLERIRELRCLAEDPGQPTVLCSTTARRRNWWGIDGGAGAYWAGRRPAGGIRDADPTGLEHLAAKALARVRIGQNVSGTSTMHGPAGVAMTVQAPVLTWDEFAGTAMAGVLDGRRRA